MEQNLKSMRALKLCKREPVTFMCKHQWLYGRQYDPLIPKHLFSLFKAHCYLGFQGDQSKETTGRIIQVWVTPDLEWPSTRDSFFRNSTPIDINHTVLEVNKNHITLLYVLMSPGFTDFVS